jgi:hypothetical protein
MHMLMCIIVSTVAIVFYRAIWIACLHDGSMIRIGVEGAYQEEEKPSHHHVAPGMSLPYEPSQHWRAIIVSTLFPPPSFLPTPAIISLGMRLLRRF